jgi:hypothetical protein
MQQNKVIHTLEGSTLNNPDLKRERNILSIKTAKHIDGGRYTKFPTNKEKKKYKKPRAKSGKGKILVGAREKEKFNKFYKIELQTEFQKYLTDNPEIAKKAMDKSLKMAQLWSLVDRAHEQEVFKKFQLVAMEEWNLTAWEARRFLKRMWNWDFVSSIIKS